MNSFEWSAGISLSHARPIAARMHSSRNRTHIFKGKHIPSGSTNAETNDRKILWVIFAGKFCSVPRQRMRLYVSTFQLSSSIENKCASDSKLFTISVDLSVSGVCDLTSSSLVIHFVNLNPLLLRMSLIFCYFSTASWGVLTDFTKSSM